MDDSSTKALQLIENLRASTGKRVYEIAQQIVEIGNPAVIVPLGSWLDTIQTHHVEADYIDVIVEMLCATKHKLAIDPVVRNLHKLDFKTGWSLFVFGTSATPTLISALGSQHVSARCNAAYLLGQKCFRDNSIVEPLIQTTANSDESPQVRLNAVCSLGWIGDIKAIPILNEIRDEFNPHDRDAVSTAIVNIQKHNI